MPKCVDDPSRYYKGDEPSPKGYGYCAHARREGERMQGTNGGQWIVKRRSTGSLYWAADKGNNSKSEKSRGRSRRVESPNVAAKKTTTKKAAARRGGSRSRSRSKSQRAPRARNAGSRRVPNEQSSGSKPRAKKSTTTSATKNKCSYTGNEPSPKGFGDCAHLQEEGSIMEGTDGNDWIVKVRTTGSLYWARYKPTIGKAKKTATTTPAKKRGRSRSQSKPRGKGKGKVIHHFGKELGVDRHRLGQETKKTPRKRQKQESKQ